MLQLEINEMHLQRIQEGEKSDISIISRWISRA